MQNFYKLISCLSMTVLCSCGGGGDDPAADTRKSALEVSASDATDASSAAATSEDTEAIAEPIAEKTTVPECQILPSNTSTATPKISNNYGNHCVYHAQGNPQKLFVFLGASSSNPSSYTYIGKAAAAAGLHSIGLAYVNSLSGTSTVQGACNKATAAYSPQCTGDIREEQLTGNDTSGLLTVNPADSLNNRLYQLLIYLNNNFQSEHWSNFISGGDINWSKVSIGGLSQGSGLAGYTAKRKSVGRACMLSGPADFDNVNTDPVTNLGKPAAWLSSTSQTSPSLMYAFDSTKDNIVDYTTNAVPNWNALGLTGTATDVNNSSPPYGNSHRLTTSLNVSSPHTSTAKDDTTPITAPSGAASSPTYAPVWNYACFQ